jgi:hypothetical protein
MLLLLEVMMERLLLGLVPEALVVEMERAVMVVLGKLL